MFVLFTGFKWDRQWMIVNANGKLLTQRAVKKLALIEVTLPDEALDCRWGSVSPDAALCECPFFVCSNNCFGNFFKETLAVTA